MLSYPINIEQGGENQHIENYPNPGQDIVPKKSQNVLPPWKIQKAASHGQNRRNPGYPTRTTHMLKMEDNFTVKLP